MEEAPEDCFPLSGWRARSSSLCASQLSYLGKVWGSVIGQRRKHRNDGLLSSFGIGAIVAPFNHHGRQGIGPTVSIRNGERPILSTYPSQPGAPSWTLHIRNMVRSTRMFEASRTGAWSCTAPSAQSVCSRPLSVVTNLEETGRCARIDHHHPRLALPTQPRSRTRTRTDRHRPWRCSCYHCTPRWQVTSRSRSTAARATRSVRHRPEQEPGHQSKSQGHCSCARQR